MEVQAHLRNLRMSPRKVRLVIDLVRGKGVNTALTQLSFLKKDAAEPVFKLIKSAMANAAHNHQLDASTLRIKTITADGGPVLKRFRPRAHGSAAPIRKRTTHISLTLTDEPAPAAPEKKKPAARSRRRLEATPAVKAAAPAEETSTTN
jgi:large subunit ribosomal protein L22